MEEYDPKQLPGNPKLLRDVSEFLEERKREVRVYPEKEYECHRCADCCRWNYFLLNVKPEFMDLLYSTPPKYYYGYWILTFARETPDLGTKLHLFMPIPGATEEERRMFRFTGDLPRPHLDFLDKTGRRHGSWEMRQDGKIAVYSPAPCEHLNDEGLCDIYESRPIICRDYFCGRYLKGEEECSG